MAIDLTLDLRLCLVTDPFLKAIPGKLEEVVTSAIKGGVTMVQLREKNCSTREYVEVAKEIRRLLNVPLIINDRIDVALASGADGVHLGNTDLSYRDARNILGPDKIIGVSVNNLTEAQAFNSEEVTYLGVSPIFDTPTKPDAGSPWGLSGLKDLRKKSHHKLVAIGGIRLNNVKNIVLAGADGVAVVSEICSHPSPEESSRLLRALIDQSLSARKELYETV